MEFESIYHLVPKLFWAEVAHLLLTIAIIHPHALFISSNLVHKPGFLQQILIDVSSFDHTAGSEVDINVFPETAGVVVSLCFCITKSCKEMQLMFKSISSCYVIIGALKERKGIMAL